MIAIFLLLDRGVRSCGIRTPCFEVKEGDAGRDHHLFCSLVGSVRVLYQNIKELVKHSQEKFSIMIDGFDGCQPSFSKLKHVKGVRSLFNILIQFLTE